MRKLYMLATAFLCLSFSSVMAQFTTNVNATALGPSEFQLTPNGALYNKGSVWNNTPIDLRRDFELCTQLYFGASDAGADGMAFMFQSEGTSYIGNWGAGLGYHRFSYDSPGPVSSFIVEFDTYQNAIISGQDIADPADDHLGFMSMSNAYHSNSTALAPPVSFGMNIEDGSYHDAKFTWNATTHVFTVQIFGKTYTYTGDIVNTIFQGNPIVYWGCTASTGSVPGNEHKCKFNTCPPQCNPDKTPPVIVCPPSPITLCLGQSCYYTVPRITATDNCCLGLITYTVTGATCRYGLGTDASGYFNPGTSTITWTVRDKSGNVATCTTQVIITKVTVSVANAYSGAQGCQPNTIYLGCGSKSLTLTANASGGTGPYTYKWSTGETTQSITVSPSSNGVYYYTVTVTDSKGCVGVHVVKVKVKDCYCNGLNGNQNKDHKVVVCHNGHEICIDEHAVPAHLAHGDHLGACDDDDDGGPRDRRVTGSVLTESQDATSGFGIQPNPSKGQFEIRLNNQPGNAQVVVTNATGTVVERRSVLINAKGQSLRFDLSRQGAGVYFIQIMSKDGIQVQRVLIQR